MSTNLQSGGSHGLPSILVLLLACCAALSTSKAGSATREQQEAVKYCEDASFTALYSNIQEDLRYWDNDGITAELMEAHIRKFGSDGHRAKGAAVLFQDGQPFILTNSSKFEQAGHHIFLIVAHMELMLALSKTFGAAIQDVEFVFGTGDEPSVLLPRLRKGAPVPPMLRFCKSQYHADVLVPDIHFQMRNFTGHLLSTVDAINKQWPWEKRKPMLFGRFSPYWRAASALAPKLYRSGLNNKTICKHASEDQWSCDVRKHFIWGWARKARASWKLPVDVAQQPKKDMAYHASHKWLLHLDGQSCSSRLEQLLALGSLVVKEESGYYAFFHHLMKPYQHYVPFWVTYPEEAGDAIKWAQQNDAKAKEIGAQAQALARTVLHRRALMCYWFKVLQGLARRLRYKPGPKAGERQYPVVQPVQDYMAEEGRAVLEQHRLQHMEFWD